IFHINKINDYDTAQVSKAQLARNDLSRLQIGFKNGVIEATHANKSAGIDIHGGKCLGLIDNQVAAGLEVYPSRQGFFNFVLNSVQIEQWTLSSIMIYTFRHISHIVLRKRNHPLKSFA